jgi:hypothetical protein
MGEFSRTVLSYFVAGLAGGVLGGFVVWLLACRVSDRPVAAPAGYAPSGHGEETVEVRTAHAESTAVAAAPEAEPTTVSLPPDFATGWWAVSKTQRLDPVGGETVRILVAGARVEGEPVIEAPYAWLTRNGNPDKDRAKLTRTQELDEVSG